MTIMTRSGARSWWGKELPKEVAYLYHNGGTGFGLAPEWQTVTFKENLDKKREKQKWRLQHKRHFKKVVPCFVWVFYNNSTFFSGWWIYIKTLKKDYGINFRHEYNEQLICKVMTLIPMGVLPVIECFEEWAKYFSVTFSHTGFKRLSKQGLAKCWCEIDECGNLSDLLIKNPANDVD